MPGSVFKIVIDGGDWGSPIANEATFDNLEGPKPKRAATSSNRDELVHR